MAVADPQAGWRGMFRTAFKRSRSPMALLDEDRRYVDVNGALIGLLGHARTALIGHHAWEFVPDGPLATEREWRGMLTGGEFTGQAELKRADGGRAAVQYAAHPELVTGRRLILFVALQVSRRGRDMTATTRPRTGSSELSAREIEIIALVAHGATSADIAGALHLSNNTVRTHVRNAMAKLDVHSRAQLVAKVMGEGLILR